MTGGGRISIKGGAGSPSADFRPLFFHPASAGPPSQRWGTGMEMPLTFT